jgi:phosphatidate cytidylyltransferase
MDLIKLTKVEAVLFGVLVLLAYTVLTKNTFSFDEAAFVMLSTLYLGMGFFCFIEIRNFSGIDMIFYAIGVIWSTDSGAYFIGKSLGKRKLWPEISPNKTVGGFVGGIVVSVIFAVIYQMITSFTDSYILILITTVFLSVFGQIGDLVESALKRHYQVKDSGHILPGHGGMFDRFDSFLFVMPLMYFFLRFF